MNGIRAPCAATIGLAHAFGSSCIGRGEDSAASERTLHRLTEPLTDRRAAVSSPVAVDYRNFNPLSSPDGAMLRFS
jgi:hypothetical protein